METREIMDFQELVSQVRLVSLESLAERVYQEAGDHLEPREMKVCQVSLV